MVAAHTNLQLANHLARHGWAEAELARLDRTYRLTVRITMRRIRASGEPLLAHVVRTAGLVAEVDRTPEVVLAALAHATYMLGDFGHEPVGITDAKRAVVTEVAGAAAEALVHDYTVRRWQTPFIEDLLRRAPDVGATERAIALIRIANEVEDHLDLGMRYRGFSADELRADTRFVLMADLAGALGWPDLARSLDEAVRAELDADVPPALTRGRQHEMIDPYPSAGSSPG